MAVLKQLIKEFWFPFIVAIAWTLVNSLNSKTHALIDLINIFAPTFFLTSWVIGQYFRVSRQTKVENGLQKIEKRISSLLENIEQSTALLFSQMTGGNSFCYISLIKNHNGKLYFSLMHQGDFALFDLSISIINLDEFEKYGGKPEFANLYETKYSTNILLPLQRLTLDEFIVKEGESEKRFNIFYSARNGLFHELLRVKIINDEWVAAFKVEREKILLESIDNNFTANNIDVNW